MFIVKFNYNLKQHRYEFVSGDCAVAFAAGIDEIGDRQGNISKTVIEDTTKRHGALTVELANIPLERMREIEDMIYEWAGAEDITAVVGVV